MFDSLSKLILVLRLQLSMLVCLAYGLKYIHGEGTKAWRDSFITVIFYALVAIQVLLR